MCIRLRVARPDALDESNAIRSFSITWPHEMPYRWPVWRQDALYPPLSDHVLVDVKPERAGRWKPLVESARDDHDAELVLDDLVLLIIINRLELACLGAHATIDAILLVDLDDPGNCLREGLVNRLGLGHAILEIMRAIGRACVETRSTTIALARRVSRLFPDSHVKVADKSRKAFDFRIGKRVDVRIPVCFEHDRPQYSNAAVIGRKGPVKLGHLPACCRGFFNDRDVIFELCKIQGRLEPGNTTTDHECLSRDIDNFGWHVFKSLCAFNRSCN